MGYNKKDLIISVISLALLLLGVSVAAGSSNQREGGISGRKQISVPREAGSAKDADANSGARILKVAQNLRFGPSLPSSPQPFYPPTPTGPQPYSPVANPPSPPPSPVTPSKNAPEPGITNPRTGEFYPGTFGGVINPKTGAVLPKVDGGYLNPQTGEVIPKQ